MNFTRFNRVKKLVAKVTLVAMIVTLLPAGLFPIKAEAASGLSVQEEIEKNGSVTVKGGVKHLVQPEIKAIRETAGNIKTSGAWLFEYTAPNGLKGMGYCINHDKNAQTNMTVEIAKSDQVTNNTLLSNTYFLGYNEARTGKAYWEMLHGSAKELFPNGDFNGDWYTGMTDDEWQKATQLAIWMATEVGGKPAVCIEGQMGWSGGGPVKDEKPVGACHDYLSKANNASASAQRVLNAAKALHAYASWCAGAGMDYGKREVGMESHPISADGRGADAFENFWDPSKNTLDFSSAGGDGKGNIEKAYNDPLFKDTVIKKETVTNADGVSEECYVLYWMTQSATQPARGGTINMKITGTYPEGTFIRALSEEDVADLGLQFPPDAAVPPYHPNTVSPSHLDNPEINITPSTAKPGENLTNPDLKIDSPAFTTNSVTSSTFVSYYKICIPVKSVTNEKGAAFTVESKSEVLNYKLYLATDKQNVNNQGFVCGDVTTLATAKNNVIWASEEGKFPEIPDPDPDPEEHTPVTGVISKIDTDGNALANAIFEFTSETNGPKTYQTNALGEVIVQWTNPDAPNYLKPGTYKVREKVAPAGFNIDDSGEQLITLNADGSYSGQLVFVNTIKPYITVNKVDGITGNGLYGAIFEVYKDGKYVGDIGPTNDSGEIKFNGQNGEGLSNGYYEFVEKQAPEGYLKSPERLGIHVDLSTMGEHQLETGEVTFKNYTYPSIKIQKLDRETQEPLAGATFEILIDGTPFTGTVQTGADGFATITYEQYKQYLTEGKDSWTITVTEITAPDKYNKDNQGGEKPYTQVVELKLGQELATFVFEDTHYRDIKVYKRDAQTNWPLAGATFRLHCISAENQDAGNITDRELTTDEKGYVIFEDVPNGTYEITEVAAPDGYVTNGEKQTIVVTSDSDPVIEFSFENEPKSGILIRKIDSVTKQPVAKVEFKITPLAPLTAPSWNAVTDENGLIVLENLDAGTYRIEEITTVDGYVLNTEPQLIEVKNQQESYTVTFENNQKNMLNILKLDAVTKQPLAGARFEVRTAGGTHVANVETGINGYAQLPNLKPGSYVVQEIMAPEGHLIDPVPQTFEVKDDDSGNVYTLVFCNNPNSNIYLRKYDAETKVGLEGATFRISLSDGTVVKENAKTDAAGFIHIGDLKGGTYIIEETAAPAGYLLDTTKHMVTIKDGETKTIEISNKKPGGFAIQKVDVETGEPLKGATFELKKIDGKIIGSKTTGEDGFARWGSIDPGWYTVTETAAPDGYILDSTPKNVEVKEFVSTEIKWENSQNVGLTIVKRDKDTEVPLKGAIFEIRTLNGDLVETLTTGANGVAASGRLTPGWYHIVEVKAPDGYVLNEEKKLVEVKADTPITVDFFNVAQKGITIHKVDATTNKPLAGAVFEVRTADDKLIDSYTTDASGTAMTKALDPGYYNVVETKAPDGYVLNEEKHPVEVADGKQSVVTVKNFPETVIQIYKTDAVTGDPLHGAEFEVLKAHGATGESIGFVTTDKTGWAFSQTLESGEYIVRETKAPEGYSLDKTEHRVTVTEGKNAVLKISNAPETSLTISKIDKDTKEPVAGAVFELRYDTGSGDCTYIGTYVTDVHGLIHTQPLKPGFYLIKETKAADGYILDSTEHRFCVKAGEVNELVIENQKAATLIVRKIDSKSGEPVAGAVFKLENADTSDLVGTLETDANGEAIFTNLEEGFYIVTETQAPPGYSPAACPSQTIHVEYGKNNYVDFKDDENGSLVIILQDKTTGNYLAGGQFIVTRESDQIVVFDGSTDTTGTIVVGNLLPGWYTVEQKFPPDKYTMIDTVKKVEILIGQQQTVYFKDVTAGLVIEKIDAQYPTVMLEGARFQVKRNSDNIVVGEYVTGKDGLALIDGLEEGLYTVTELTAPLGYALDAPPQLVHVKDGTTAHVTFEDTRLSSITVKLVEEGTGNPIVGATVEIWQQNGELVGSYVSDSTGVIQTDKLPAGHYVIKIVNVPDGYAFTGEHQGNITVELKNGIEVTQKFEAAEMGSLKIITQDAAGKTISDVKVKVTTMAGTEIGEYTTGSDGTIVVPNLKAGWYKVIGISAPDGYAVSTEEKTVEVMNKGQATVTLVSKTQSNIIINTFVAGTRTPVAGVAVEVWQQNGALVNTYTSDKTGVIQTDTLPAGYYVLKVVSYPDNYTVNTKETTLEVKDGTQATFTFELGAKGNLKIMSVNGSDQALSGMKVTITTLDGAKVGEYSTGKDGSVIATGLMPGWYIVREIKAPDGYTIAAEPEQRVEVKSDGEAIVKFVHGQIYGLQIITTCQQTNEKVPGAKYEIRKMDGAIVGTYTSDKAGLVFVELEPGWYTVRPTSAPDGYSIPDDTARNIQVKADGLTTTEFVLSKMSSIRVKIVDGATQRGVYGVRLQLKNANSCINEYYTDNEGYIQLDKEVLNGKYTLEMISAPDGYHVDTVPKSISTLVGQTTEIVWAIYKEGGQIQVVVTSSDYNKTLDKPVGAPLQGAVFEIMNADTYQVVGRMISDASGVAASSGLPIGRYMVKQVGAPAYYAASDKQVEVRLKINNDVVRTEFTNASVNMWTAIGVKSNNSIRAGSTMRVDITAAKNGGDVRLDNFYVHLKVPTDAARITTLSTGTWNHAVFYKIVYKTNMNDYRTLAENLSSTNSYQYGLSTQSLGLQSGEYVTDIRMEFGTVPAGFIMNKKACYTEYVLATVYNGHKLINRVECGGQYNTVNVSTTHIDNNFPYSSSGSSVISAGGNSGAYAGAGSAAVSGNSGQWVTGSGLWTTTVSNSAKLPSSLPKTGY